MKSICLVLRPQGGRGGGYSAAAPALPARSIPDKTSKSKPSLENFISPATETQLPAITTAIGSKHGQWKSIPRAMVRNAEKQGAMAAITSENAAETMVNEEFSAPIENPKVNAMGKIPQKNSLTVGAAGFLPSAEYL